MQLKDNPNIRGKLFALN